MRDQGNDIERIKTKWLVLLQMKIFFPLLSCPARHKWSWIFSSKTLNLTLNTAGDPHILKCSAPPFLSLSLALSHNHHTGKNTHTFTQTPSDSNIRLYVILCITFAEYQMQTLQIQRLDKYRYYVSYLVIPGLFQSIGSLNGCQYQPLILRAKRNMSNTLRHNMAHHHATSCSDVVWWQHQKFVGLGTAGYKRCEIKLARGHMKHSTFKALSTLIGYIGYIVSLTMN